MKRKTQPKLVESGNYLEQGLFKGLNKTQKNYAEKQLKKFKEMGVAIPYGVIRKTSLTL